MRPSLTVETLNRIGSLAVEPQVRAAALTLDPLVRRATLAVERPWNNGLVVAPLAGTSLTTAALSGAGLSITEE